MQDVTVFKLVSVVAIWLVGLTGGLIPALLATKKDHSPTVRRVLSILNAFSGGVFLAGGFLHLLASAVDNPALQAWSAQDDGKYAFPYAEMFCTVGFLSLLLLEQAAHAKMSSSSSSAHAMDDTDDTEHTDASGYLEDDGHSHLLKGFSEESPRQGRGHGHGHGHGGGGGGHSHMAGIDSSSDSSSLAVAVVLFIALSFHSMLEGLGIGAQTKSAWGVFMAIVVHKGLAAFALGSGMVQSSLRASLVILYMVLFSFMSIIGIIVGWLIAADSSGDSAAAGICVALASGTFIYVAVMEVIPQEFPRHPTPEDSKMMPQKTAALCLGYAIFGMLAKWA